MVASVSRQVSHPSNSPDQGRLKRRWAVRSRPGRGSDDVLEKQEPTTGPQHGWISATAAWGSSTLQRTRVDTTTSTLASANGSRSALDSSIRTSMRWRSARWHERGVHGGRGLDRDDGRSGPVVAQVGAGSGADLDHGGGEVTEQLGLGRVETAVDQPVEGVEEPGVPPGDALGRSARVMGIAVDMDDAAVST